MCHAATGVAQAMKAHFGDALDLRVYHNNAVEAEKFEMKSAASVFVNGQSISLTMALSKDEMKAYLKNLL